MRAELLRNGAINLISESEMEYFAMRQLMKDVPEGISNDSEACVYWEVINFKNNFCITFKPNFTKRLV